jgi:hypothetical protein
LIAIEAGRDTDVAQPPTLVSHFFSNFFFPRS